MISEPCVVDLLAGYVEMEGAGPLDAPPLPFRLFTNLVEGAKVLRRTPPTSALSCSTRRLRNSCRNAREKVML
jgi:hypothetical protein